MGNNEVNSKNRSLHIFTTQKLRSDQVNVTANKENMLCRQMKHYSITK